MSEAKKRTKTKKPMPVALTRLVSAEDAARMAEQVRSEPYEAEMQRWSDIIAEGIVNGAHCTITDRIPSRRAVDHLKSLGYSVRIASKETTIGWGAPSIRYIER